MNGMVNTNMNRRSSCTYHLKKEIKGLMEIEALYKHTKIKAAHYINTSDDVHIGEIFPEEKGRQKSEISIQRC